MATFKRFEDIEAWQKSRILANLVATETSDPKFKANNNLRFVLKKTSGSIMDNIAEGFERGGTNEFKQFLSISKGSTGEIRSQFYRALDQNLISQDKFTELYNLAEDISKMLEGLITYLKNSGLKGNKFK